MKPRFGYDGFIHFEGLFKGETVTQITGYHVRLRKPGQQAISIPGEIIHHKGGKWAVKDEDTVFFFSTRAEAAMFLYNNFVADKL